MFQEQMDQIIRDTGNGLSYNKLTKSGTVCHDKFSLLLAESFYSRLKCTDYIQVP